MVNRLKMAKINTLHQLIKNGWSDRRIAGELGIHRETVAKYRKQGADPPPKPAISTAGSGVDQSSKPAISTAGSEGSSAHPGNGRQSFCRPFHDRIEKCLLQGLSAKRIYQDLLYEDDFPGSYESVKRYVRRLSQGQPLPFRRMECPPGEEAQVDFGKGAMVRRPNKKYRRPHLFRILLSHSRKGYSEVVDHQTTEEFIRCLENAFYHFGGVPKTLVIDNLKAAVQKADWYDPDINPKFAAFARHYQIAILPTKPYTPRHKGKVEGGVKYVQENALKGRTFSSLEEQNRFLQQWESRVADQRIHGTTRKHVKKLFTEVEKSTLHTLPEARFPFFHEGKRKVHRDGHVAIKNSYYSVPPEYFGREVWVRWDSHFVRVFSMRLEQIAVHARVAEGRFSTCQAHLAAEKINPIEKGTAYQLSRVSLIGPESMRWAQAMLQTRGIQGIRVLQGFLTLAGKYETKEMERVTKIALSHEAYRLKELKRLLEKPQAERQLEFIERHPLIREMADYEAFVKDAFGTKTP